MNRMKKNLLVVMSLMVTAVTSCSDIIDMEEDNKYGIVTGTAKLYNGMGKGPSALDVVNQKTITGTNDASTGAVIYSDPTTIDFKSVNDQGRASTLVTKLTSKNGTKYRSVTESEYTDANVNNIKELSNGAGLDTLYFTQSDKYFVAKLGNNRGYALAKFVHFSPSGTDQSATNTGALEIEYRYIPLDAAK